MKRKSYARKKFLMHKKELFHDNDSFCAKLQPACGLLLNAVISIVLHLFFNAIFMIENKWTVIYSGI